MTRFSFAAFLTALLVGGSAGIAAASEPAPFETMRSVEGLQDQIATGDALAQAAYAKAILRTGRIFAEADPSIWNDKRNARGLIVYLFSGGDARAVGEAIPRHAVFADMQTLYSGALAYGRGDDDAARKELMPIDAKSLSVGLGGHLALVQATLVAGQDQAKAIALLDLARLLEPGTLVEEAALRKEISLIGATGDLDKFVLLTRRYLGAFSRSIYSDNFRQLVAQTVMQLGAGDTAEEGAKLTKLMAGLDQTERRRLYLAIARKAVIAGHTTMAALAGEEASRLAKRDASAEARAKVYFGAATIVGDRYDVGLEALSSVTPDRLSEGDRSLRSSALALAEMIRKPVAAGTDADAHGVQTAIFADAERSLAKADILLKEPSR